MLPEKIAVDATALISASIKGRALRIFLDAPIQDFKTCAFTFEEAKNYLPFVCQKTNRTPLLDAELILQTLPIEIYNREYYHEALEAANRLIGKKDRKDVDLLALALHEQIPIWSEDSDFQTRQIKSYTKCYTTAELFRLWEKAKGN